MRYQRMIMEVESPEELGYENIRCNLAESSLPDMALKELGVDLDGLVLRYDHHRGNPELREVLASAAGIGADEVLVTAGAAMALFVVATALLGREDHLVVARPNYAVNLETPRAIGCEISYLDLEFEQRWRVDASSLEALLRPNTRLVSLTSPHNPTGTMIDRPDLAEIAALTERRGIWLLVDETYREMAYAAPAPPAVTLGPRVIGVASMSKAFGLPGIRTGWLMCRDSALMTTLLAAKEQIQLTGSVIDEHIAAEVMAARDRWLPRARARILDSFATVRTWMAGRSELEWVEPSGGVVCFPRIKEVAAVDVETFYRVLRDDRGTLVGPGHWFEQPKRFMRLGFGWPSPQELADGLAAIGQSLLQSRG